MLDFVVILLKIQVSKRFQKQFGLKPELATQNENELKVTNLLFTVMAASVFPGSE